MQRETIPVTITIQTLEQDVTGAVGKPLSKSERAVYWMLKSANGRIVTYDSLWDGLYSIKPECDWADDTILKVWVSKLRKKLPRVEIRCHFALGYSLHEVAQ
jgi:DNA-binding response OmpR family regulator